MVQYIKSPQKTRFNASKPLKKTRFHTLETLKNKINTQEAPRKQGSTHWKPRKKTRSKGACRGTGPVAAARGNPPKMSGRVASRDIKSPQKTRSTTSGAPKINTRGTRRWTGPVAVQYIRSLPNTRINTLKAPPKQGQYIRSPPKTRGTGPVAAARGSPPAPPTRFGAPARVYMVNIWSMQINTSSICGQRY